MEAVAPSSVLGRACRDAPRMGAFGSAVHRPTERTKGAVVGLLASAMRQGVLTGGEPSFESRGPLSISGDLTLFRGEDPETRLCVSA